VRTPVYAERCGGRTARRGCALSPAPHRQAPFARAVPLRGRSSRVRYSPCGSQGGGSGQEPLICHSSFCAACRRDFERQSGHTNFKHLVAISHQPSTISLRLQATRWADS
jgi:hypothetical protein